MDPSVGWALSWWIAWFLNFFGMEVKGEPKQRSGSIPGVTRLPGGKPRQPKVRKQSGEEGSLPDDLIDTRLTKASAILD